MKNLFKKTIIALFTIVAFYGAKAQTSNILDSTYFQAVARDDNNNALINQPVQIRLLLRQGGPTGTPVYGALYQDITNQFGEFGRVIGSTPDAAVIINGNTVNANFSLVPWQNGNMWVILDLNTSLGSPNFRNILSVPYKTVPYAFAARTAEKLVTSGATIGQVLTYNGSAWAPAASPGVPVGTIIAYGGNQSSPPAGWLFCDGASYATSAYPALYGAIINSWGSGGTGSFNVPDLRGRFLRGMDGNANLDPEKNFRQVSKPGGLPGNNVGSIQGDAFQGHQHFAVGETSARAAGGFTGWGISAGQAQTSAAGCGNPITDGSNGTPQISSETRPKNAYVMYIIKYQ